jgi:hypothetical protein
MTMQRYSDQQVPLNNKTHNSLRQTNPPNAILYDSADHREDPSSPRSIPSQNEFANSIGSEEETGT